MRSDIAVQLGLVLVEGGGGEPLAAGLALQALLVEWLPGATLWVYLKCNWICLKDQLDLFVHLSQAMTASAG